MSAGVPFPVKSTSLPCETVSSLSSLTLSVPCTWHSLARRRPLADMADLLDHRLVRRMLVNPRGARCCGADTQLLLLLSRFSHVRPCATP